ncbi:MAG: hypothetical protein LPK19_13955 [Hymenobacteraceae bacterium]|nr:hypothetical protein [Hymenobacteraceae bacterium]MDX5397327.1 hypothetical protein [Hymenobacteraceae bacterium]MDX5513406.1 hypothetical protein [Hymenobacteraceae bacterium]
MNYQNFKLTPVVFFALLTLFSCDQGERYKEVSDHRITTEEYYSTPNYNLRLGLNVEDFGKWRQHFDDNESMRKKSGLEVEDIYRSTRDTNTVMVIMRVSNIDSAKTFMQSPQLKQIMKEAGVLGEPEVTYYILEQ